MMSSFTQSLFVEILMMEVHGRGLARLEKSFSYYEGNDHSIVYEVPVGFVTDFMSVPAIARGLIPVLGKTAKAAVLHDYLLSSGIVTPQHADGIFKEALGVLGEDRLTRWVLFIAVRIHSIMCAITGKPVA